MFCKKCRAQNEEERKFCGECGAKLEPQPEPVAVDGDSGAFYCTKHNKVVTRLRCGRCDTPYCDRCLIFGPTGTRCRACARHRTPIRARGVAHEVAKGVSNVASSGRGFWFYSFWAMVLRFIASLFGRNF
jgi:hypothetical protein